MGRSSLVLCLDPKKWGKSNGKSRKHRHYQHQSLEGVNHKTTEVALNLLAQKGLLLDPSPSRRRKIVLPENNAPSALRVAIVDFDAPSKGSGYMIDLRHRLVKAGHVALRADKTLEGLRVYSPKPPITTTFPPKANSWECPCVGAIT